MNLQKMMQQAQQMQQKMNELQTKMESQECDGIAGSGMVKVRVNGKNRMLSVAIDPSLLKPEEKEMLEDLIMIAYHDARDKLESGFSDEMSKITSGLNLPPGMKLPF